MSPNPIREFLLGLLRDPGAAAAYRADPARALHAAGLEGLTPQDIAAMAPMAAESALIPGGERLAAGLAGDDGGAGDMAVQDHQRSADIPSATAETWSSTDISRAFDF